MKRRSSLILALAASLALSIALAASADTTTVGDPRGDNVGGSLDLKSATAAHTASGLLKHTIVQYNPINRRHPPALVITGGNKPCNGVNYNGYVIYGYLDGGKINRPACSVYQGSYTKSIPNANTVVYKFSKAAIGNPRKYYWAIRISGSGEGNMDELPNKGNPHAVCPGTVSGGVCNSGWAQWMVLHRLP